MLEFQGKRDEAVQPTRRVFLSFFVRTFGFQLGVKVRVLPVDCTLWRHTSPRFVQRTDTDSRFSVKRLDTAFWGSSAPISERDSIVSVNGQTVAGLVPDEVSTPPEPLAPPPPC